VKFVVYMDRSRRYRWRLVAGNGHTIATSDQAFSSKATAKRAATGIRDRAGAAEVVEERGLGGALQNT
jgi:uncharacterized protein YegP (UPF0339 family)